MSSLDENMCSTGRDVTFCQFNSTTLESFGDDVEQPSTLLPLNLCPRTYTLDPKPYFLNPTLTLTLIS